MTRGIINLRIGSVPSARIASTCSVTTIEPSSDAIPDALRPDTSSAVTAGPNSRTSASDTASPVNRVSPKTKKSRPCFQHDPAPKKDPRHNNDGQRADPDNVHLFQGVQPVVRRGEHAAQRLHRQQRVILHSCDLTLQYVAENSRKR